MEFKVDIIEYLISLILNHLHSTMGNCCSGQTVDNARDIKTLDHNELSRRVTLEQLALVIKVQATIRGYLTRKKIRVAQMNMGIYQYDPNGGEVQDDYDNAKVQVSLLKKGRARAWEIKGSVLGFKVGDFSSD